MSPSFYQSLPAFRDFNEIMDERHFQRVPADWSVVLTDVKGSTVAIEAGRYKDVNRIGAAAVVCAQNAMPGEEFPFVFGGDGATLLAPPHRLDAVCQELARLKSLSQANFGLELRVGVVSVRDVNEAGARIEVAKFELAGGKAIAVFRGGGLAVAEKRIKSDEARYGLAGAVGAVDLDTLSCRWNAVPSSKGRVLSLLAVARQEPHREVYREILAGLEKALDGRLDSANPIQLPTMTYRSVVECLRDESRHFLSVFSKDFLKKALGILVAVLSLKYRVPLWFFDPVAYAASIPSHSDYRKFDDALRMIIDCRPPQVSAIEAMLAAMHREGRIFYGLHAAGESLITCYVNSTREGDHVHFVDGGDGGYAMAAKQLKAQMKAGGS